MSTYQINSIHERGAVNAARASEGSVHQSSFSYIGALIELTGGKLSVLQPSKLS